jgi:predicted dehydrogenase
MIRLGIVGAGAWGLNHVRAVATEPSCVLVAVADPDEGARVRASAIAPAISVVADADALIGDPSIDGLIIASPAPTHVSLARSALAAGKHVLVEKPLALSLTDAGDLHAAGEASRCVAMVGHLMAYHPAVERMRELLASDTLGPLHYIHATRVHLGRLRHDESALWSFGPHELSMIDFLLERSPTSVAARGQSVTHDGVEDIVFLTMRYAGGEMANIHLSRVSPHKERRLSLVCAHKVAELDDVATDKLRIYTKGYDTPPSFTDYAQYLAIRDEDVHIPRLAMDEPLRLQLRHMLSCIRDGRTPRTDLASGLRVTAVLDAAQRSLALDGAAVEVANPLRS